MTPAFLDALASDAPTPGGGAAAAMSVAMAAALTAMAARRSAAHIFDNGTPVDEAEGLRAEALRLADADAEAYGRVLEALRHADPGSTAVTGEVHDAFVGATDVPLRVAEIAATVSELAARLAVEGNPVLRGDAATAAMLGQAGARAAAVLVRCNVDQGGLARERVDRALAFVASAERAAASLELLPDSP